ncbi:MAG: hypothetical protein AB9873_02445 [Syntrophobacteraceae bacterium]
MSPLVCSLSPNGRGENVSDSRCGKRLPVLIAAPGGGLGHLVRACAVSTELAQLGVQSRVATHSPYAHGLSRLTRCVIDFIPAARWKQAIPRFCEHLKPHLVVLDTFPWGIRGEWARSMTHGDRMILMARRLNVPAYLRAASLEWGAETRVPRHVIAIEPLSPGYRELLEASGSRLYSLPGRIRPLVDGVLPRAPLRLEERLRKKATWLVVHSGPVAEVQQLIELARKDMGECDDGQIVTIVPEEAQYSGTLTCQFFPASRLYPYVHRVVTGAGYNCVAETAQWRPKHLCLPFPRRYDEQEERFRELSRDSAFDLENGVHQAAQYIASLL